MSNHACITLQFIGEKNAERLRQLRVPTDSQTVGASLMCMVAALGELATLSCRDASSLSPFERSEAGFVLGRMTVALSTIGRCLDIDLGAAALMVLGEGSTDHLPRSAGDSADQEPQRQPFKEDATAPLVHELHHAGPPGGALGPDDTANESSPSSLVLSPASRDSFFTYLDRLAGDTKEAVEKADLRWVAPNEDGLLEELIPDGRRVSVPYSLFPTYFDMVQRRRRCWRQVSSNTAPARFAAHPRPQPETLITMEVPGYDAANEARLFSPTHFSNDLFSPRAAAGPSELLQAEVKLPAAVASAPGRAAAVGAGLRGTVPAPYAASPQTSSQQPRNAGPPPTQLPRQPMDLREFDAIVDALRSGAVSGPTIAQLGLTFCFPRGDSVVELTPDGLQIMVTSANCAEFLRLLDEARRAPAAPATERIHRMDSVRRLQPMVAPSEGDTASFSPSHFHHGLFAPFDEKSTFYVDYDEAERTLPPFLKQRKIWEQQQQQPQPQQQQPQQQPQAPPPPPPPPRAGPYTDLSAVYTSALRNNDLAALAHIVGEVRASASAVTTYGVTFAVPSSLEPNATLAEKASGVHELFPGSSKRFVKPGEQAVYLAFAQPYFPDAA